jgi:hypothetical protein
VPIIWAGRTGTRIPVEKEIFCSPESPDRPTSLLFNWYRGSFPGIKRPGGTVHHSPPSRAEVRNECSYTSNPRIYPHSVDRDNFVCTFILQYPFRICGLKLCKHSSICSMGTGIGNVVKEREGWCSHPSGIDSPPAIFIGCRTGVQRFSQNLEDN